MQWLNYHHLLYFWTVAREGSVTRACEKLHLTQPTISAQLRQLEKSLGAKLFERQGRRLVLTDTGRAALQYADEIFALGQEMQEVVAGRPVHRPLPIKVGIPDALPKLIAFRILEPVFRMPEKVQLHCAEGNLETLYADMAAHQLDLVLSDSPAAPGIRLRAFSHLLGESTTTVFGTAPLAATFAKKFPQSLSDAPILLPGPGTLLKRTLDQWFDDRKIRPQVVAEIQDGALTKTFGSAGLGLFVAPSAIEKEVCAQYKVRVIGRLEEVKERFYVITPERRIKHPAATAITTEARERLFA
jgi:LysR family transcriptional regulator, transcriptional activator of nhaA